MTSTSKKSQLQDAVWPTSCPLDGEDYFISIGCGNSTIHWALHNALSKYETQSNLQPFIMWKTPHITVEDLDDQKADVFARLLPRKIQQYFFGTGNKYTKEVALETSQKRGHNITYYIISSNDEQAEFIASLLSSVPCRIFRMKGDYFFSKSEGFYDTMGVDRCACLKGSSTIYGTPSLVIDGGTAITYTALDSAGKILGGGISPGVEMRLKAMNEGTGALPCINYEDLMKKHIQKTINEKRPMPIYSRNTEQAMVVATLNEIATHLRSVISHWLDKVGPGNEEPSEDTNPTRKVVVTGGSGDLIAKLLQPDCGGMLQTVNGAKNEKHHVSWENTMLHNGVAAALLQNMKKNYVDKETREKEEQYKMREIEQKLIGKRVAKFFQIAQKDGDNIYRGTVESCKQSQKGSLFHIGYDDNDSEEIKLEELEEIIELYKLKGEKNGEGPQKRAIEKPNKDDLPKKKRAKHQDNEYLNKTVAKMFEDGVIYYGVIKAHDGDFWKVRYEDGDREDFDLDDVKAGIALCKKEKA